MPNLITHGPAEVTQWCLVAFGVAGNPNTDGVSWPVYADNEPDKPDNCVTVFETTGQVDGRTMDGEVQEHHGLQVRVRGTEKRTAFERANLIRATMAESALDETVAIYGTSRRFALHCFSKFGPLIRLGNRGAERRTVYTFNVFAAIRQLS